MTALITGASRGIGAALAKVCARNGHSLVLVSRNARLLEELAATLRSKYGVAVTVIPTDLSIPAAPQKLVDELDRRGITVDLLINNAGFGLRGSFVSKDLAEQLEMIQVNVTSLTQLTGLLLSGMVSRGRGRILNIASTAGFQPGPLMAVYYATKAFVLSFTEALAAEVRGSGVTVTVSCPGPVATGFQARAGIEDSRVRRLLPHASVDFVAAKSYSAMIAGKRNVIPGFFNRVGAFSIRFMPRWVPLKIIEFLHS